MDKPVEIVTVGRSVHFVMPGGGHRSAVVVETGVAGIEDSVDLTVYLQRGDSIAEFIRRYHHVPFCAGGELPYSWHWPERDTGLRRLSTAGDSEANGNR